MQNIFKFLKYIFFAFSFSLYGIFAYANQTVQIDGVSDMLEQGQNLIAVAAKWGGVATVVGAAIALGSGRLEGALAQTLCKVLIVIGLLMAAGTYFAQKISWGFLF